MTEKFDAEPRTQSGAGIPASREVRWWPVHEFISALVAQTNTALPTAGTPAWAALADNDPEKILSLAVAGEHHVLRTEIGQEERAQAAEDVWSGEDWSQVARQVQRRHEIDSVRRTA